MFQGRRPGPRQTGKCARQSARPRRAAPPGSSPQAQAPVTWWTRTKGQSPAVSQLRLETGHAMVTKKSWNKH